jgi:dCTP deaminase
MLTGQQICNLDIIKTAVRHKVDDGRIPSYGMDGMGYTLRSNLPENKVIEPGKTIHMKSHDMIIMPQNCGGLLYIKSTYARQDLILITNSPVDPGYVGYISLNLFNAGTEPVVIYYLGGIAMLVVHQLEGNTQVYEGRWQNG